MSFAYEEEATLTAGIDAASVVTCLAFSPRDDFLLAGLRDSFVVWTLDGTLVLQFTMGYNVESVAWTGAMVALVGCQGGVIVQVNITQGISAPIATYDFHIVTPAITVSCLTVHADLSQLLLAGETHCSLWTHQPPNLNVAGFAWALANTLPNPHGGEIVAAQFMPNNRAAVAFRQHGILIYDLQSLQSHQLWINGNVLLFAMISANASTVDTITVTLCQLDWNSLTLPCLYLLYMAESVL
ncbi:hypothetical protein ONZ45_g15850 [Pleurotus djamor]|nr:hypothetical protein ONZ45_g15850 [Pleurotus djamor]